MRFLFKGGEKDFEGLRRALLEERRGIERVADLSEVDLDESSWVIIAADEYYRDKQLGAGALQGGQGKRCRKDEGARCGAEIEANGTLKLSCALREVVMSDKGEERVRPGALHFEYCGPTKV